MHCSWFVHIFRPRLDLGAILFRRPDRRGHCRRIGNHGVWLPSEDNPSVPPAAAYLESLNPEQRRAVEHGAPGPGSSAPLLVIAGAGSGKNNTFAHRVAHLIVGGADPRRLLLMTFSRRAAAEMPRRGPRI